ncbi:hypothetical protein [Heyndrickxia oleronia]|jgi:hypothetical protein|uniref:Uncharacterized protein n=1 Tax=Heyndrickxia oleronia TaxID=38875 RepID=A0A8E2LFD8_9BACI|nr:hypothetical protein [Heyndrickxia oleronia]OJH17669.1 hypothetical protein BLX88_17625 [Bacillus obstructivus]MCI1590437.1 hypothetical protein [Heyndrickxia oleronia]MCI1611302.1 hypothetical protein [Heyndrickxia oleronia]MCI1742744.1 hypothetical protein [Heyndrickxia oleronia]MCI1762584.1 hypothetical protein [Heyndrickxia oleronia]
MAEAYFKDELASYIGLDIELGMQPEMTDGLLEEVNNNGVRIARWIDYGLKINNDIALDTIHYVRIL